MPPRTVLLTAAGGHIGAELVPRILHDQFRLVLPTSNAARLRSSLPPGATKDNVAVEEGSIKDPAWIESILKGHGVDTVFLCLTGMDELFITLNFLDAMRRAGTVKHVAYVSACGDFVSDSGLQNIMAVHHAAHVVVKSTTERKLMDGGYPWTTTVLGPALFWSNDLRSKASLLENGFFDEPLGTEGVSRVSTEDVAAVALKTIAQPNEWAGKKIMIGSRKIYRAPEIERLWSEALGKQIKMCGSDEAGLQDFEKTFVEKAARLGHPETDAKAWGRDLKLMYQGFAEQAFGMSDADYELQVRCLGREPRSYDQFVLETGRSWVS